jgi:hypothetical protein
MSSDLAAAIISVPVSLFCAAAGLGVFKLAFTVRTPRKEKKKRMFRSVDVGLPARPRRRFFKARPFWRGAGGLPPAVLINGQLGPWPHQLG